MKSRPILFNSEMVRAVLDGRKTQTRRIVKGVPEHGLPGAPSGFKAYEIDVTGEHICGPKNLKWGFDGGEDYLQFVCPYGKPGDELWVRETHAFDGPLDEARARYEDALGGGETYGPYYRADRVHENTGLTWRPSIHMPRWASRITLTTTDVRVERVQEITAGDAGREGVDGTPAGPCQDGMIYDVRRDRFRTLWDSINDKRGYGWDKNPWVWVVEFEVKS